MSHTIDFYVGHIFELISRQIALSDVEAIEGCNLILILSDVPLCIDVYEVRCKCERSDLFWRNLSV